MQYKNFKYKIIFYLFSLYRMKTISIDIKNIDNTEALKSFDCMKILIENLIDNMNTYVIAFNNEKYDNDGLSLMYLLDKALISIHTIPKNHLAVIDIFSNCGDLDVDDLLEIIFQFFNKNCIIEKNIRNR